MAAGDNLVRIQDCINISGGGGYNALYDLFGQSNEKYLVPYQYLHNFNLTVTPNAPSFSNSQLVPAKYVQTYLGYLNRIHFGTIGLFDNRHGDDDIKNIISNYHQDLVGTDHPTGGTILGWTMSKNLTATGSEYRIDVKITYHDINPSYTTFKNTWGGFNPPNFHHRNVMSSYGYYVLLDTLCIHGNSSSGKSEEYHYRLSSVSVSSSTVKSLIYVGTHPTKRLEDMLDNDPNVWFASSDSSGNYIWNYYWTLVTDCEYNITRNLPYTPPPPNSNDSSINRVPSIGSSYIIAIFPGHYNKLDEYGYQSWFNAGDFWLKNIIITLHFVLNNENSVYTGTINRTATMQITFKQGSST